MLFVNTGSAIYAPPKQSWRAEAESGWENHPLTPLQCYINGLREHSFLTGLYKNLLLRFRLSTTGTCVKSCNYYLSTPQDVRN